MQLLATGGLPNFSTTKVAKLAGIPQSNLYIYFQNKQDLLNAVYQTTVHEESVAVVAALTPQSDLTTQLATSITALYDFARQRPQVVATVQALTADAQFKHQLTLKQADQENQQIQALIQRGVAEHVLRPVDLNLLRYFLTQPVFHFASGVTNAQYADTPTSRQQLTTMLMAAILTTPAFTDWQAHNAH